MADPTTPPAADDSPGRWRPAVELLALSVALAAGFEALGLPAGLLLGPLAAAVWFASRGTRLAVPDPLFVAAQALIGLLIAPTLNPRILATALHQPELFLGATLLTLALSGLLGWALARWQVLPGTAAVWGSMPGAATAMVLMARDEGADWQLVALMSFLRVTGVALLASVLAVLATGHAGHHAPGLGWFPPLDPAGLAVTLAIGGLGAWAAQRLRVPAGALLGPMALGAALSGFGWVHLQLPGWLLAPAYLLVGWRIGLGFTPPILAAARRAARGVLAATAALLVGCAAGGWALAHLTGKSLLTCYLATSPGGADSVAIIASATPVDVPFVMSMQVLRFVLVIVLGPPLSRFIARRVPGAGRGA